MPSEGVTLSKQGGGVWLAGVGGEAIARKAAAALRLECSTRAAPDQALYRLGPIPDPAALQLDDAEAALRAILAAAARTCAVEAEEKQPLQLSPPGVRTFQGEDWYVWLGEGGQCDGDGRPILINQQFSCEYGDHHLIVGVGPAAAPDDTQPQGDVSTTSATAKPGVKSFAAAAATARNVAQPLVRRKAPAPGRTAPAPPQPTTAGLQSDGEWRAAGRGRNKQGAWHTRPAVQAPPAHLASPSGTPTQDSPTRGGAGRASQPGPLRGGRRPSRLRHASPRDRSNPPSLRLPPASAPASTTIRPNAGGAATRSPATCSGKASSSSTPWGTA